jgi:4-amino-4-deoxy-L-arabinose transferase-like glycosyltransferase
MKKWRLNLPLVLLLLAVIVTIAVRVRLLTIPLERDEGEFAYAGQLMLQGVPPYQLFYNMKFPGIYAAYAVILEVFGQSDAGIRVGLVFVNLAAIFLLYRLARRFLDVPGSAAAAAAFALLSVSPIVLGCEAHATQFVVPAALAALLLLLRGEDSGKLALFFGSGLLFSIACLMKQPGALFGIFGFCLLAVRAASERAQWRVHALRMLLFVTGLCVPMALTAVILWHAGVFERFWFWTVVYAKEHASEIPWRGALKYLGRFLNTLTLTSDGLFWVAGGLGLVSLLQAKGERRRKYWLVGFLVCSCIAVVLSNYFSSHYFVMLLPALALLTGQAVSAAAQWARTGNRNKAWAALPAAVFILIWTMTVFHHRYTFFVLTPEQVCRKFYGANPFIECRQIGLYLREHSPPDARIVVLGSEPELLFYARRHSGTGYIYMYDLIAPQPFAEAMQREMIAEVEAVRPQFLVFVKVPTSWDLKPDFHRTLDTEVMSWMTKFVLDSYQPAGVALIKTESEYYWGKAALNRPQYHGSFISVFERK